MRQFFQNKHWLPIFSCLFLTFWFFPHSTIAQSLAAALKKAELSVDQLQHRVHSEQLYKDAVRLGEELKRAKLLNDDDRKLLGEAYLGLSEYTYESGIRYEALNEAAALGNTDAMLQIAYFLDSTDGNEKYFPKHWHKGGGLTLILAAAALDNPEAILRVAQLHRNGERGQLLDPEKALDLEKKAVGILWQKVQARDVDAALELASLVNYLQVEDKEGLKRELNFAATALFEGQALSGDISSIRNFKFRLNNGLSSYPEPKRQYLYVYWSFQLAMQNPYDRDVSSLANLLDPYNDYSTKNFGWFPKEPILAYALHNFSSTLNSRNTSAESRNKIGGFLSEYDTTEAQRISRLCASEGVAICLQPFAPASPYN